MELPNIKWIISVMFLSTTNIVERGKFRTTEKYFLDWSVDDGMKTVFG